MRLFQLLAFVAVTSFVGTPLFAEDVQIDARKNLETAIPEGIRLLEAKKYKLFLKNFVHPKELKHRSLEESAETFAQQKAPALLQMLKQIKNTTPIWNKNKTAATYKLKKSELIRRQSITFVKKKKHWHIKN